MIRLVDILKDLLEEKKADRCKRIADRKYDKPSAYKSGAIVRCRKGKIWKDIKEDQINELGPNDIHFQNILDTFDTADNILKSKILKAFGVRNREELMDDLYALEYRDALEIEDELGISLHEAKKETLRTWFKRKGAPGKTGGWVDCNSLS